MDRGMAGTNAHGDRAPAVLQAERDRRQRADCTWIARRYSRVKRCCSATGSFNSWAQSEESCGARVVGDRAAVCRTRPAQDVSRAAETCDLNGVDAVKELC